MGSTTITLQKLDPGQHFSYDSIYFSQWMMILENSIKINDFFSFNDIQFCHYKGLRFKQPGEQMY